MMKRCALALLALLAHPHRRAGAGLSRRGRHHRRAAHRGRRAGHAGARHRARICRSRLGQSFAVENRAGGGTTIGSNAVAKSAPDGYTLLMATSSSLAINVTLQKALPYDPVTDFVPLAAVAQSPFLLLANPSVPAKSVAELIAYGKANPDKLSFASAGIGTPHDLFAEMFMSMTGIKIPQVRYKGSLPGDQRRDRRPCADHVLRRAVGGRCDPRRHGAARSASPPRRGCRASRTSRRSRTRCPASRARRG